MFIANLAVSDALVCCVGTPLTLMELLTKHWPLPDWPSLCKACGAIQAISIFVSTISITAIALDRYQVRLLLIYLNAFMKYFDTKLITSYLVE